MQNRPIPRHHQLAGLRGLSLKGVPTVGLEDPSRAAAGTAESHGTEVAACDAAGLSGGAALPRPVPRSRGLPPLWSALS